MKKLLILLAVIFISTVATAATPVEGFDDTVVQWLLNATFTIISLLAGWLMHLLHESIRDLHASNTEILNKVHTVELLVAGEYVKKPELAQLSRDLLAKLDRIEERLEKRAI